MIYIDHPLNFSTFLCSRHSREQKTEVGRREKYSVHWCRNYMSVHISLLQAHASLAPGIGRCSPPLHGDHFLHHFTLIHILSSGCLLLSVYISKFSTHLLQRTPYLTSHSFPLSLISIACVATLLVLGDRCPSILGVYHASFCTACGWLCFLI